MKNAIGLVAFKQTTSTKNNAIQLNKFEDFDADLPPMTDEELNRARHVPRIKTLRRAMKLTQEAFSATYQIPLGTLRDWEQGATEPDAPARAYLRAIAGDPAAVLKALNTGPLPTAE